LFKVDASSNYPCPIQPQQTSAHPRILHCSLGPTLILPPRPLGLTPSLLLLGPTPSLLLLGPTPSLRISRSRGRQSPLFTRRSRTWADTEARIRTLWTRTMRTYCRAASTGEVRIDFIYFRYILARYLSLKPCEYFRVLSHWRTNSVF
jgi:hypothetical protein